MKQNKNLRSNFRNTWVLAAISSLLASGCQSGTSESSATTSDWEAIHEKTFLADIHNDAIYSLSIKEGVDISGRIPNGETDLDRLKEGGVDLQVFVLFSDGTYGPGTAFNFANRMADSLDAVVSRNPEKVALAKTHSEALAIAAQNKLVALMAVEGGHMIEDDLAKIDSLHRRGMTYLTLTWNNSTSWATSAADEVKAEPGDTTLGLKGIGESVVKRLNDLGVIIDLSHAGEKTFYDVLKVTTKPVMATHSNCYELVPHPRNLKDEQIRAIKENDGVIGLNFYAGFVNTDFLVRKEQLIKKYPTEYARFMKEYDDNDLRASKALFKSLPASETEGLLPTMDQLMDHLDHIVKIAGIDHVAVGSDFDGGEAYVEGLVDVSDFPKLTEALVERGYSETDIEKILSGNFMRVFKANNP